MRFFGVLGGITLALALFIGLPMYGFKLYEYFAPKYTEVDRKVFEESRAFNEGMVRDLGNLKLQYLTASPAQKEALRATVLHRFSVYPEEKLSLDLRTFYRDLQNEGVVK